MGRRLPEIDGLSFAISKLVHLVATLLESHFAAHKLGSPHDHAGFDLRLINQSEEAKVVVQIMPRGWAGGLINASFYRGNARGNDWEWMIGGGGICAPKLDTIIFFEPMRDPSGKIVLGKIVEPARKVPLTGEDFNTAA